MKHGTTSSVIWLLVVGNSLFLGDQVQSAGVKSRRAFYDTPFGQIHYKYGGDFSAGTNSPVCCTFLLIHGNPRSSDEFRELISELANRFATNPKLSFSFVAMDLFGEGHSDDPVGNANDSYVTMEQYADYMLEITGKVLGEMKWGEDSSVMSGTHDVRHEDSDVTRYIIPIGSLTGTAIATELSYRLKYGLNKTLVNCEVLTTILHDPMYYFSASIVASVHYYADLQRKWQPQENGQHLLDIWNDPNFQPYENIGLQDRKSLDRFRAATTQWQVILSYADYSSQLLMSHLTALSKSSSQDEPSLEYNINVSTPPLLILYGGEFLNDPMTNKIFEVQKMKGLIWNAVQGGCYEHVIEGGNQALLSQNVTIVADIIMMEVIKTTTH